MPDISDHIEDLGDAETNGTWPRLVGPLPEILKRRGGDIGEWAEFRLRTKRLIHGVVYTAYTDYISTNVMSDIATMHLGGKYDVKIEAKQGDESFPSGCMEITIED